MKKSASVVAVLMLAALGQIMASESDIDFSLLEKDLMTAVMNRDQPTMERLLADEYQLTSSDSSGTLIGKRAYILGVLDEALLKVEGFEFKSLSAQQLTSDVVIVRCVLAWRSTYRGKPWNADFLITDVWLQKDKQWRLVSRHSSYPASELPRIVRERFGR